MIQQNVHNNGAMTTTGCLASLAAYTKQARMSSDVRKGNSVRTSCGDMPEAK